MEEIFPKSESLHQLAADKSEPGGNELICPEQSICGFLCLKNLLKNIVLKWSEFQQNVAECFSLSSNVNVVVTYIYLWNKWLTCLLSSSKNLQLLREGYKTDLSIAACVCYC